MVARLSVVCAVAVAGAPVTAPDDTDPTVLVRPLEVEGDVAEGWRVSFETELREGLGRQDAHLVPSDAGCGPLDSRCWQEVAQAAGADYVVRARVVKDETDYTIALELWSVASQETVAEAEQTCELCGLADAGALLEDVAGTLAARVKALSTASAVVLFESAPAGATLIVDGEDVGTTPLSRELEPGSHEAEAALDGHVSQRRSFETEASVNQTVRFELAPLPRERANLRPLGWAGVGVGVAAILSGGVLIAIDEEPITSRCSGENVNARGVCKFRRNTLAGGIALLAGGVVAVAVGAVLVARSPKRARRVSARPGRLAVRF